jgi:hypothetical protein
MPRLLGLLALLFALGGAGAATAQPTISWSTLAYLDYAQPLHSHDENPHGEFSLRRLYLTADAATGTAFSSRARLEVNARTNTERGLPAPFVKDLYVWWEPGGGHRLTFGLHPPPAYRVAESVWGYRSLARTLANASGAVSSRDFGASVRGPVAGDLGYGLMVGNNEGVRVEDDQHKRVYGRLQWLPEPFALSLHADYASYDDERDDALTASAFAGVETERYRLGVEGVWQHTGHATDDEDLYGVGVFAVVSLTPRFDLVARSHWQRLSTTTEIPIEEQDEPEGPTYVLFAASYQPAPGLFLMPNVYWEDPDDVRGDDALVARFTLSASF